MPSSAPPKTLANVIKLVAMELMIRLSAGHKLLRNYDLDARSRDTPDNDDFLAGALILER
jgi:hypothetical protein